MKSLVATVLKGTLDSVVEQSRAHVVDKLKDGDVVDQKILSLIVNEMESNVLKLDAGAKTDLGASFSALKEGFIFLNTVLDEDQSCDDSRETSDEGGDAKGRVLYDSNTSAAFLSYTNSSLTEEMTKRQFSDLEDSRKVALSEAKKRFSEARHLATKAFNNNALTLLNRVHAM